MMSIVLWTAEAATYGLVGALATKTLDLAIGVDLVVLEHSTLHGQFVKICVEERDNTFGVR